MNFINLTFISVYLTINFAKQVMSLLKLVILKIMSLLL